MGETSLLVLMALLYDAARAGAWGKERQTLHFSSTDGYCYLFGHLTEFVLYQNAV